MDCITYDIDSQIYMQILLDHIMQNIFFRKSCIRLVTTDALLAVVILHEAEKLKLKFL